MGASKNNKEVNMKIRLAITSMLAAFAFSAIAQEKSPKEPDGIMRECGYGKQVWATNRVTNIDAILKKTPQEREAEYEAWALKKSNELKAQEISDFTKAVSWEANITTNDLKVLICTDVIPRGIGRDFLFREFHFSKDGRLLSVSPVRKWATTRR